MTAPKDLVRRSFNGVNYALVTEAGAPQIATVERDLGAGLLSGSFDITGLTGQTAGKPVMVAKAAGPYTGKGTLEDEAEMDMITATGYVLDATTIRIYWQADAPQVGNVKFNYMVGA